MATDTPAENGNSTQQQQVAYLSARLNLGVLVSDGPPVGSSGGSPAAAEAARLHLNLQKTIGFRFAASGVTAAELSRRRVDVLSTGSVRMDRLLNAGYSGIRSGQITEVVGQSGSGKTQLCLSLSMRAAAAAGATAGGASSRHCSSSSSSSQSSPSDPRVIYIDSTLAFSPARLVLMYRAYRRSRSRAAAAAATSSGSSSGGRMLKDDDMLRRVQCHRVFDAHGLLNVLSSLLSDYRQRLEDQGESMREGTGQVGPTTTTTMSSSSSRSSTSSSLRLVVIDSITAVLAGIVGGANNAAGHGIMMHLGHLMNRIAVELNVAVLVTNSTVDNRDSTGSSWSLKKPALGVSWTWVPSVQIFLHHNNNNSNKSAGRGDEETGNATSSHGGVGPGADPRVCRYAELRKSPGKRIFDYVPFIISGLGITDL